MLYYKDLRKTISTLIVTGVLYVGAISSLDYSAREYRTHLQRMENDSAYKAQVLNQRKQEKKEIRELNQKLVDAWRDKHKIPGLEQLVNYF
ncbi:hypothetical protein HZA96_04155 [Candidatus Woesearchaeota archaeon]|nr:hypothetical protein [Candidatus Woesearchaeota archaeon]